ncbi:IS3 family transposase ISBth8 [Sporomusa paucivorans]
MTKKARFEIIHALRKVYRLGWLFEIAKVSRQGYYKWLRQHKNASVKQQKEQELKEHIVAIHQLRPYFGYLRMVIALAHEGFHVNHKRVYRIMKELGIQSMIRKKRRYFGKQPSVVQPNRLERDFKATAPGQKLVTDITYLPFNGQFFYLSAIQDLFNNEIVAYEISARNDLKLVLNTIDKLSKKLDVNETIIHSDQGFQYTSSSYNKRLEELGALGSHSRKGNCLDNACIESFFSHLKTEMLYITKYTSVEELYQGIDNYICFYNSERFQKRLNHLSPIQYREKMAA